MTKKSSTVSKSIKNPPVPKDNVQIIKQVRGLAWSGEHTQAIELASQELSASTLKLAAQLDLLDIRAESHIAQGKFDLAAKDANAMVKLAKSENPKSMAQALNRKALVQMRMGDSKAAVKTAVRALKASQGSKQKSLIAQSLFRLSESQMRAWQSEAALENGQKAIALFQELDDPSGTGHAYWSVACAYADLRRAEESRLAAHTALELCQSIGDQYGIGNALNALTLTDADIADNVQHIQWAKQAYESAGYTERIASAIVNLSNAYYFLGLYSHAIRLLGESVSKLRAIGAKGALINSLVNLSYGEIILGKFTAAHLHLEETETLNIDLEDPQQAAYLSANWGDLSFAEGDFEAAIRHYKSAVKIAKQANLHSENVFLAFLGKAHLANHSPAVALKATTRATNLHRAQNFAKPDGHTSQEIWWWHTRALAANKKNEEARKALDRVYDFLIEGIQNIRDVGLRRNYLNKVAVNGEFLQFWVKDGAKRKLPKERLFAYLNIESNLRDPFKRLANTSLRLNTLKTAEAIQTFLVEEATELSGGERVMLILEKDGKTEVTRSILPRGENVDKVLASIQKHIDQARLTRTVQLILPHPQPFSGREKGVEPPFHRGRGKKGEGISRIVAPLIAQNQLLGYLYGDMDSLYGRFDETDRDMLGMLANQGAVALNNASLLEELERKVEERTAELNQHVDELAILNSVGEAMAKTLDVKTVARIVGDKIQNIFVAEGVTIRLYDRHTNLIQRAYDYDIGYQDLTGTSFPLGKGLTSKIIETGLPLRLGTIQEQDHEGGSKIPTQNAPEEVTQSYMGVPIITSDEVIGTVAVHSYRQHAYNESDVRFLQTLASNMGVAIQNARLFEAEQERVAELQIINSIQQGLAAELDFRAIVDLVGARLKEILNTGDLSINWYDEKTDLMHYLYTYEHGDRLEIHPMHPTPGGQFETMRKTRQPIIANNLADFERLNIPIVPGTDTGKSLASVPIISSDRVLGGIQIENHDRENAFGESELRLLTTIAASLGTALENARLFDETQRLFKVEQERVTELQIINSIQQGLAAELDFQAIVNLVGDKLSDVLNAGDLGIAWYDEKANLMHYLYTYEHGERIEIPPTPPTPGGQFETMRKTRQPFVLNSVADFERAGLPVLPGTDQSQSIASVPIISSDRVLGAISLENYERENAFGESELRLLTTIAASLGTALENARLFNETQRLLKETEQRNAELAIINSVQAGLVAKMDIQGIYDLVGDKLRDIFDAQVVDIGLYDRKDNLIHFPYTIERGVRFPDEPIQVIGYRKHVMENSQPLLINQSTPETANQYGNPLAVQGEPPKSILYVPMLVGGESRGVISIQNLDRENAFSDSDVRLLQTLANSMSVALENARLFDETQRLLKETEERNAELAIINSVQQGLASKLEMQAIYDLIGNKIRDLFSAQVVIIGTFDRQANLNYLKYAIERGTRISVPPLPIRERLLHYLDETHQSLVINQDAIQVLREYGIEVVADTDAPKSLVFVPLTVGSEVKGMISLQNLDREHAFNESDVRLLQTLANSMSIAIENARLSEEIQSELSRQIQAKEKEEQRRLILEKVITTGQSVTEVHDVRTTLMRIWHGVHDDLGFDRLGLYLFNREKISVDGTFGTNDQGEMVDEWDTSISLRDDTEAARFFLRVIDKPDSILLTHTYDSDYNIPEGHVMSGVKDFAAIGAWAGTKPVAVICVDHKITGRRITDEQLEALRLFAGYAGLALENARLSEEIQNELSRQIQAKEKEEHRRLILEKVITTGQRVTEVHDVRTTLMSIWRGVHDDLGFDRVGLYLYNSERNAMDGTFGTNNQGEMIDEWHTRVSLDGEAEGAKSFLQVIEKPDTILLTHTYESDNRIPEEHIMSGVQDFAAIAAWAGTKPVAAICVDHKITGRRISEEQLEALRLFAGYAGLALENARLFDETQRLLKETEQRNAELAIINSVQAALAAKLDMQ